MGLLLKTRARAWRATRSKPAQREWVAVSERDTMILRQFIGTIRGADVPHVSSVEAEQALDRIASKLAELEADRFDLEACAELIVKLDENGPARGNRERVKLMADWQRARKAAR